MNKKQRIKKYNPYNSKEAENEREFYQLMLKLSSSKWHDIILGCPARDEYIKYVNDCIDMNIVPIKWDVWINEQSFKFHQYK